MSDEQRPDRRPGGRPSKYDPAMCERARAMAEGGAVDLTIADALGIAVSTLYAWKSQFPEFSEALKRGKDVADDAVEAALFRRATGYSHDAVKVFQYEGAPVVVPYVHHYPPDTTAGIFWLKNRRPEKWRDKQEIEHSGAVDTRPDFSGLSKEKRDVLRMLLEDAEAAREAAAGEAVEG